LVLFVFCQVFSEFFGLLFWICFRSSRILSPESGVKNQSIPISACSGRVCHDSSQFDCSLPFSRRGDDRSVGLNRPCNIHQSGGIEVRLFRKSDHCLFVEEEVYNWGSPKSRMNRSLLFMSVIFIITGVLFSVLRHI
jgi:hypothetical protein